MSESARVQETLAMLDWTPSVYFAESVVRCPLDYAWKILLNYEDWNPTFAGAQVRRVKGEWRKPGELILIKKHADVTGTPLAEFYAHTVVAVEPCRIIWYVHPVEGHLYRNFVDFGLSEGAGGVRFSINYYAQNVRYGELTPQQLQALEQERAESVQVLQRSADAFKTYCEARVGSMS